MHKTSHGFWNYFDNLSEEIQKSAKRNFALLKFNPSHPSLHFKKIGKFWSVRVGINHRAIAFKDGEDFIWVWIGNHDEYEKILGR